MIICTLRMTREFGNALPNYGKKKKYGRYHGSCFSFKRVPFNKWVIGAYINVDYKQYLEDGLSESEIVSQCIEFLNTPPPRKKYQRKKPQPIYGEFEPEPMEYIFKEDDEGTYIQCLLITNQRKNKLFWGQGPRRHSKRKYRKER